MNVAPQEALTDPTPSEPPFSISEMRSMVTDLFAPKAAIYWFDLVTSATAGWLFFFIAYLNFGATWAYGLTTAVATLALYRAWVFTHELAHLKRWFRRGYLRGFQSTWQALVGYPLLSPAFMYHDVHLEHHDAHEYSRDNDAEYLPFGAGHPWNMVLYPLVVWPMPLLAIIRFSLLSTASALSVKARAVIRTKFSSAGMVLSHVRPLPRGEALRSWNGQELIASTLVLLTMAGMIFGLIPISLALHWYIVMCTLLTINYIRALTAHRYTSEGEQLTFHQQFLDSVNVSGSGILTELWAPVGTRYHALHHLFPALPYHSLPTAHRRLMKNLPNHHPYRKTVVPGLLPALTSLWSSARAGKSVTASETTTMGA